MLPAVYAVRKYDSGSTVYCFEDGDVYHKGTCRVIKRKVISIDKEEAKKEKVTLRAANAEDRRKEIFMWNSMDFKTEIKKRKYS